MDKFYVHSVEIWGRSREWAVFERLPWPKRWRKVSRDFKIRAVADRHCERMSQDWRRYQAAMTDKHLAIARASAIQPGQ